MTERQQKVFRKYTEDLKKYLILSFAFITVLLGGGLALAVFLHGFQTVYILFPLMWILVVLSYIDKISFLLKAKKDFHENRIRRTGSSSPSIDFDTKNCFKIKNKVFIGYPKYTIKDDLGRTFFLYVNSNNTEIKNFIFFTDCFFGITYLENSKIILSISAEFIGPENRKEFFSDETNNYLKDYIA